jgi:Tol biopolymer transport system component
LEERTDTISSRGYNLANGVLSRNGPANFGGWFWSPDGKQVGGQGGEGRTLDIYRIALDGSSELQAVFRNDKPKYGSSWTRDSRSVVFMQFNDPQSGNDIWIADVDGEPKPRPLVRTAANELGGRLTPDNKWLAYVSNESGRFELFVTAFAAGGRGRQVSTDGASEPIWSRDGRELFFKNGKQVLAVSVRGGSTFEWAPARLLFEGNYFTLGGPASYHWDVATDGRFLMLQEVTPSPRLRSSRTGSD